MSKKGKDKEKEKEIPTSSDYTSPFGTPLTKLPLCTTASGIPNIPVFVHSALTYLEQYGGTQLEGIFRISGSTQNVQRLKQAFATGEKTIFTKGDDLYDVACLVKLFFRELPESLCTFELYDCFIAAQGFPPDHIVGAIGKVIDLLPPHNKFLLMYLSEFMQKVRKHESVNKMGSNNLAIVFTPNILRAKVETIESIVGDSQRAHQITLAFFESEELFKKYREKIEKDKNAMIEKDEQKAREFKAEMEKRYKNHQSETEAKIQQEFNSKQTTQEAEEYEKKLAETVAKLSVGLVDENSLQNGEETWDASEYKQVYNRTLRGFKNKTRPSATVVSSGEKRSVLGRQRNSEPEHANTEDQPQQQQQEKKEFKMDKNTPMDLSKMYFGKR